MPFILLAIILLVISVGDFIPLDYQSWLLALSISIKSLIIFVLPFVVFSLLFKAALYFSSKGSKMILLVLLMISASNFLSTLISYLAGSFAYGFDLAISFPDPSHALISEGLFTLPVLASNSTSMFAGLVLGVLSAKFCPQYGQKAARKLELLTKGILRMITWVMPLFLTGFMIKMHHDRVIHYIWSHYTFVFTWVATAVLLYIGFMYLALNRFSLEKGAKAFANLLPASLAGFSTMSSAAAMPLTLIGAEKNAKNGYFARSIIPITVNVHLIGDCFAIPIFAFVILKSFGVPAPDFPHYLIFASYFVLAKFSVAAVPGGGILVMLPILEQHLGFNGEMLSLITALYLLFDPVITAANILGNGGFAMGMEKIADTNQSCEIIS